jgi:hypothetical protein
VAQEGWVAAKAAGESETVAAAGLLMVLVAPSMEGLVAEAQLLGLARRVDVRLEVARQAENKEQVGTAPRLRAPRGAYQAAVVAVPAG